jgi:hypothetical protein
LKQTADEIIDIKEIKLETKTYNPEKESEYFFLFLEN